MKVKSELIEFYLKTDIYAIMERLILLEMAQVAEKKERDCIEARLKKERNFIDIKADICNWLDYLHGKEIGGDI